MRIINTKSGKEFIVDDADFEWLNQWKWSVNSCNYAGRYQVINEKKTFITMHRLIMKAPKNKQVDHINGNRFDNRRENLRLCTQSQNCTNREASTKSKSGFRGVAFHPRTQKWKACIKVNQKKISLGLYFNKEEAALAYNQAATKYHGQFARLNQL